MRRLFFYLLALLTVVPLRAGWVFVQEVESGGMRARMTIKTQGTKIRADISPETSTIIDTTSGSVLTLLHPQRLMLEVSPQTAARLMEKNGGKIPAAPTLGALKPTGKREVIDGLATEQFACELGPVRALYSISREHPLAATLAALSASLQASSMGQLAQGALGAGAVLPGAPMKVVMTLNPKEKITTTLVSARAEEIADAEFQAPPSYRALPEPIF